MFHPKYQHIVFGFFMALLMSFLMSAVVSIINIGIPENFLGIWFHAWWTAFIVAFPTVLLVSPLVKRITGLLIRT
ncbi:DUF2798 domain-containing protein [Thiomicrorhabdus sp. 6S3-12]|uniref:DUF2798 domain-containing protein n=1 Tax=Thiomicrorhabdus sp. 6S3-12 TaxID=2819681 RepID=UPI001AADFA92|nr:DUF2798 domain-containing protein [Thiomicrorhabdus sp. 6S3-12]MBO1924709.1 DUF2798 domain-containing protein [Thiomicrorhabdus sp. 6S3-12]